MVDTVECYVYVVWTMKKERKYELLAVEMHYLRSVE
jgi:hypothetical protein